MPCPRAPASGGTADTAGIPQFLRKGCVREKTRCCKKKQEQQGRCVYFYGWRHPCAPYFACAKRIRGVCDTLRAADTVTACYTPVFCNMERHLYIGQSNQKSFLCHLGQCSVFADQGRSIGPLHLAERARQDRIGKWQTNRIPAGRRKCRQGVEQAPFAPLGAESVKRRIREISVKSTADAPHFVKTRVDWKRRNG